jgi:hypothetical protein
MKIEGDTLLLPGMTATEHLYTSSRVLQTREYSNG